MLTKRDFLRSVPLAAITTVVTMPKCAQAQNAQVKLDHAQIENIVRRSYQYVAMYNVNNKGAMDAQNPLSTHGWNKIHKSTELANAKMHAIARPNNDTLYQIAMLDLRNEPVILDVPAFDTRYASMETSAYDGYIDIPLSTRSGEDKQPTKLLFYSARTQGYTPDTKIAGVGKSLAMTGDFVIALFASCRNPAMPLSTPASLNRSRI